MRVPRTMRLSKLVTKVIADSPWLELRPASRVQASEQLCAVVVVRQGSPSSCELRQVASFDGGKLDEITVGAVGLVDWDVVHLMAELPPHPWELGEDEQSKVCATLNSPRFV